MLGLGKTELLVIYLLITKKGWMSTKSIVDLLGLIRKSESAVRATLFRLKQKDIIQSRSQGRTTLFSLGKTGRQLVSEYMDLLSRSEKRWSGKWLLFSFNIPESKRTVRNALRDELVFLGFGRLHANLWISPYDIRKECARIVKRLKVEEYTAMFITDYIGGNPKKLSQRVWGLVKLTQTWDKLRERCKKEYNSFKRSKFVNSNQESIEALARLVKLKGEIVSLATQDPCLPQNLLPYGVPYHMRLEKEILSYLDFLRIKSSSIIKFDSIEHEKCHNKHKCRS